MYKNSKIRENVRKYLCNGDVEPNNFDYIEKHTAHMIQKPSEQSPVCILMVGSQGTGKDLWTNLLSKIIGLEYYLDIGNKPQNFPSTQYKDEQKIQCLTNSLKFFYYLFFETDEIEYSKTKDDVFADYISWCASCNIKLRQTKQNFIKDLHTFGLTDKIKKIDGKTVRCINTTKEETQELFKKYLKNTEFTF